MKRVLIADDAAFMRLTLKTTLEKIGFNVVGEAENGKEALEKYKTLNPDIVTMDCTMPQMDGQEALKLIKEYDANCKVIMVTAMGQETIVRKAILAGAVNFIVKPFKEETLAAVLNSIN
jgi:two-component system, chemotaxis family, chemotaxis protein CheY